MNFLHIPNAQEHTADLKQRIEAQFSDLHQFLYQEEKLLQVKLKTEERRELIRLDEHKALLCVEISRLQRAVQEIEEKLKEQDSFTLLRVGLTSHQTQHGASQTQSIWMLPRSPMSQSWRRLRFLNAELSILSLVCQPSFLCIAIKRQELIKAIA